jgi:cellulose synthase/poly-beta-1,6-N-acetylglucosamine synthase-like glycosyltransferase
MSIVSPFLLTILFLYTATVLYLLIATTLPHRKKSPAPLTTIGVSVVIPFRNEALNLTRLITSLNQQDYQGSVEVILVNDESTDDYKSAISAVPCKSPLRIIESGFSKEIHLTSKQQALERGIRSSSFDWIAFTDADIKLEPHWLTSLVAQASQNTAMVFGHTVHQPSTRLPSLFTWFQDFQLETLFAVAYAFNRGHITGSCMGNNLLISKKAFLEINGYQSIGYSIVEDCDLLSAFRHRKFHVTTTQPFSPSAITLPCQKVNEYYHQLLRWATGGFGKNIRLLAGGVLLALQNILFVAALFDFLPGNVSLLVFVNLLLTWLFTTVAFKVIRSSQSPLLFWPFYLLLLIETALLIAAFLLRRPVIWKKRRM